MKVPYTVMFKLQYGYVDVSINGLFFYIQKVMLTYKHKYWHQTLSVKYDLEYKKNEVR